MDKVTNEDGTTKVSRPSILLDDRAALLEIFNVGHTPAIPFTVIAHRCVEVLGPLIDADTTGIMERFTQKWAVEEANQDHDQRGE